MLNEERRRRTVELLQNEGRVLVRDLSKRFHTSLITIRKDLELLHHQGLLERTHGGALPVRTGALHDRSLQEKERLFRREKIRIAAAAVKMIQPGQVVILDSGTTTSAIARACAHFRSLTIITNATNIAAELAGTAVEIILTGGTLRKNSFSLVGPIAEETLRRLRCRYFVLRRRRLRRALRAQHAQSPRSQSQSRDGRGRQTHSRSLRFQQVWTPQSLSNRHDVRPAGGHHRPRRPQIRPE